MDRNRFDEIRAGFSTLEDDEISGLNHMFRVFRVELNIKRVFFLEFLIIVQYVQEIFHLRFNFPIKKSIYLKFRFIFKMLQHFY